MHTRSRRFRGCECAVPATVLGVAQGSTLKRAEVCVGSSARSVPGENRRFREFRELHGCALVSMCSALKQEP